MNNFSVTAYQVHGQRIEDDRNEPDDSEDEVLDDVDDGGIMFLRGRS